MELPSSWVMVKLGKFVENEKGKKPQSESKVKKHLRTIYPMLTFKLLKRVLSNHGLMVLVVDYVLKQIF